MASRRVRGGEASSDPPRHQYGPAGLRRRAELMETAVKLASRNGFAATRVSDIVNDVGVGQGVFYWYFKSKDALFEEILDDTNARMRLFRLAFIGEEQDPMRRIAKGILASIEFVDRNRYAFSLVDHASTHPTLGRRQIEALRVHVDDQLPGLRRAIEEGRIRATEHPEFLAQSVVGVVDRLSRTMVFTGRYDVDDVAQEVLDFCFGGLFGASWVSVSDLRADVTARSELTRLRDEIGAGTETNLPDEEHPAP